MIEKKPFKTQIKQQESHLNGKNKSQAQILRVGEQFHKCRRYGIRVFVDFVKFQSILRNEVVQGSTFETFEAPF
jgi:hypothetical protein